MKSLGAEETTLQNSLLRKGERMNFLEEATGKRKFLFGRRTATTTSSAVRRNQHTTASNRLRACCNGTYRRRTRGVDRGRPRPRVRLHARPCQGGDRVTDFYDPEEIKRVYYPEVERLPRDALSAHRVFIFDHNVRNAGRPRISPHAPRPCHGRGSHGGGLICVSIATWQQSEPAWARGVNLASKPRFAS